jgi:exonuclease III
VGVAAFTETGLAGGEEIGEAAVAKWAAARKCPARLWTARRLGARCAAAGSSAGMALVAFGAWSARGGTERAWPNGRGLFVEFALTGHAPGETPGRSSVVIGAVYGPASGGLGSAHEKFRSMVSDEWHDCRERGLAPLFLGDLNFAPSAFDRASAVAAPPAEAAAWLASEAWVDVWRAMLPDKPGFSFARGATASRIDYALLPEAPDAPPDAKPAAVTGVWLGPLLEDAPGQSDHRPLLLELDVKT